MADWAISLHALATALGLPNDEPYRPHLTLARARRRAVDLRGWIEPASAVVPQSNLVVDTVHLMRRRLGAGPARYETLASFALARPEGQ